MFFFLKLTTTYSINYFLGHVKSHLQGSYTHQKIQTILSVLVPGNSLNAGRYICR